MFVPRRLAGVVTLVGLALGLASRRCRYSRAGVCPGVVPRPGHRPRAADDSHSRVCLIRRHVEDDRRTISGPLRVSRAHARRVRRRAANHAAAAGHRACRTRDLHPVASSGPSRHRRSQLWAAPRRWHWRSIIRIDLVGPLVDRWDSLPFLAGAQFQAKTLDDAKAGIAAMKAYMLAQTPQQYTDYVKAGTATMFMATNPADLETIKQWGLGTDQRTGGEAMADLMSIDLREDVARIKTPTLVLGTWAGLHDQLAKYGMPLSRADVVQTFQQQFAKLPQLALRAGVVETGSSATSSCSTTRPGSLRRSTRSWRIQWRRSAREASRSGTLPRPGRSQAGFARSPAGAASRCTSWRAISSRRPERHLWDFYVSIVFSNAVLGPAISHELRRQIYRRDWLRRPLRRVRARPRWPDDRHLGHSHDRRLRAGAVVVTHTILVWQMPVSIFFGFTWAFAGWLVIYFSVHGRWRREALQLELAVVVARTRSCGVPARADQSALPLQQPELAPAPHPRGSATCGQQWSRDWPICCALLPRVSDRSAR